MKKFLFVSTIITIFFLSSCKKDWLDTKSDTTLTVPTTIEDFQLLLDNNNVFNATSPGFGEISSDNFYLTAASYTPTPTQEKNAYSFKKDIWEDQGTAEWNSPYLQVAYANTILEGTLKITRTPENNSDLNNIIGSALFYRSYAFHQIASLFCKPYSSSTAAADLGIPLRLSANVNDHSVRSSVQETYDRIISDLKASVPLLPTYPPTASGLFKTRPSKPGAYGMLARVYLSMADYSNAYLFADSCLQLYSQLIDYNSITPPFQLFNSETIFFDRIRNIVTLFFSRLTVDSTLYNSYNADDLRKTKFFGTFGGRTVFKGSYYGGNATGSTIQFDGIATDEILLIRAECNARKGNTAAAMQDLNTLMIKRWKNTVSFPTFTAVDATDALRQILIERRKELCFRGLRWTDLRRLNREPQFAVNITRVVNNELFQLLPNDPKYVLPIPPDVIQLTGMQQNIR